MILQLRHTFFTEALTFIALTPYESEDYADFHRLFLFFHLWKSA